MTGASPGDLTLQTYAAAAARYRKTSALGPAIRAFLDLVAATAPPAARVLELGSGPGNGARYLETRGLNVTRTDATRAFVEMMRADGFAAALLDIRTGSFGGPFEVVLADAVLLHLSRAEFTAALRKARAAATPDGLLAITLKDGDGQQWRSDKLDLPRHFTYWREPALRIELELAGWTPIRIDAVAGRVEPWLYALSRAH